MAFETPRCNLLSIARRCNEASAVKNVTTWNCLQGIAIYFECKFISLCSWFPLQLFWIAWVPLLCHITAQFNSRNYLQWCTYSEEVLHLRRPTTKAGSCLQSKSAFQFLICNVFQFLFFLTFFGFYVGLSQLQHYQISPSSLAFYSKSFITITRPIEPAFHIEQQQRRRRIVLAEKTASEALVEEVPVVQESDAPPTDTLQNDAQPAKKKRR